MWVEVLAAVVAVAAATVVWLKVCHRASASLCRCSTSMVGKTAVITGATAGIGKETARDLLQRGARVILACRDLEKGVRIAGELLNDENCTGEIGVRLLDTSDLASVRTFAKEVLGTEDIHVLINNAGILSPNKKEVTADGLELTMAANHFGHFLLTNLLLARLKECAPSRVVTVSSVNHEYVENFDIENLNFERESYTKMKSYNQSKLCNVLFARELADKMKDTGVTSNSLHSGAVSTSLLDTIIHFLHTLSRFIAKDADSGAQTTIHLAVSQEVKGMSGRYFADCKPTNTSKLARRKDLATSLWEASVKAVGMEQHETHY